MKKLIFTSLIILIFLSVSCNRKQSESETTETSLNVVDNILNKLNDISQVDSLEIVAELEDTNLEKTLNDSVLGDFRKQVGLIFYKHSNFDLANYYFIKSEKNYRKAKMLLQANQMLANRAVLQELKGNYAEAVKIYISTSEVFKENGDSTSWANALSNIGVVYEEMEMADKAIYYDKLGLAIKLTLHDTLSAATNYNNIGVAFSELLNIPDSALLYYSKAFKIYQDYAHAFHCAQTRNNLATIYINLKDYKLAKYHLEKADHIFDSVNNLHGKAVTQRYFGELYFAQGEDGKSLEYFQNAMDIFKQIDDKKSFMEMGSVMSKVLISMGRYAEATKMMQFRNDLKDSLINADNKAIIVDMETKYQVKEKNQTIKVLRLEEELHIKKIRNQTIFIALLIIIFALVILIINFRFRQNKLEQQQLRLELQNYLLRIDEMKIEIKNNNGNNNFNQEKLKEFELSERETEVLQLISKGFKNSEIAEKLFISQNTVKTHIKNIYVKLDVKNRVEALKRVDNV